MAGAPTVGQTPSGEGGCEFATSKKDFDVGRVPNRITVRGSGKVGFVRFDIIEFS